MDKSVKLSHYIFNYYCAFSGVPQGLHLGPLLLVLFINDLPTIFDCLLNLLLFADDAKLFSVIKHPSDAQKLKSNLNKFSEWCHQNDLPLNINKYSIITYSRLHNPIFYNYTIDNTLLSRVTSIRDLEI